MSAKPAKPKTRRSLKPDPWADLLPSRRATGETFTKIVTSDTKAKVITIEAGFGQGKSTFLKAWAGHLKDEGETVIMFDAWKSDHSDDPLMAFVGALTSALPKKMSKKVRDKAMQGLLTIGKIGGKAAMSWVLREGTEDLSEWVKGFADDEEFSASLEKITGDVGGKVSAAAQKALVAQLAKEFMRQKQLPAQLANLRDALQHGKKNKGRVIVLIDELDRCRPDYAVSLLEAIKHLFEVEGYVFVLMLNAAQIEMTAARLFGSREEGEPYLAKFVDYRLRLPLSADDRARFAEVRASEIEYDNKSDNPLFSGKAMVVASKAMAENSELSLRQLDRIFLNVDIATKSAGPGSWDEPLLLFYAFDRELAQRSTGVVKKAIVAAANEYVASLAIDRSVLNQARKVLDKKTMFSFSIDDDRRNLQQAFQNIFAVPPPADFWNFDNLVSVTDRYDDWLSSHKRLIDGAADIVVGLNTEKGD